MKQRNTNRVSVVGGLHNGKSFVKVNGKMYFQAKGYEGNPHLKEGLIEIPMRAFSPRQYDSLIGRLATALAKKADVKEILVQTLREVPLDQLEKIDAELKTPKPRIRKEKGCVVLRVAGIPLTLRG